jgi:hypothetical protein
MQLQLVIQYGPGGGKTTPGAAHQIGQPKRRKAKELALVWQRGYRGHTLWSDAACVGRIRLAQDEGKTVYLCEAGSRQNTVDALPVAKRWVAEQAKFSHLQLSLL